MGTKFEVIAKNQFDRDRKASITIIGNETGGRKSVTITVTKVSVPTLDEQSNTTLYSTL